MKALALALAGGLLLVACSAQPKSAVPFVTAHVQDTENQAEHDQMQLASGVVVDFYPNRKNARQINYRFSGGGFMDLTCSEINPPCRQWDMKVTGFRPDRMPAGFNLKLPEGDYLLIQTDDPRLKVIKTAETQQTVGYWVTNKDYIWLVGSYQAALATEERR